MLLARSLTQLQARQLLQACQLLRLRQLISAQRAAPSSAVRASGSPVCTSVSTSAASRDPSGCSRRSSSASTVLRCRAGSGRWRAVRRAGGGSGGGSQQPLGTAARCADGHGSGCRVGVATPTAGGGRRAHSGGWESTKVCSSASSERSRSCHSAMQPFWVAGGCGEPEGGERAFGEPPRASLAHCQVPMWVDHNRSDRWWVLERLAERMQA